MTTPMPQAGTDWTVLRDQMIERGGGDAKWREGKTAVYVFNAGEDVARVQREAYALYMSENGLGPLAFPSLAHMEDEVVGMGLSLLHGGDDSVGNITSGGTDSITITLTTGDGWPLGEIGGSPYVSSLGSVPSAGTLALPGATNGFAAVWDPALGTLDVQGPGQVQFTCEAQQPTGILTEHSMCARAQSFPAGNYTLTAGGTSTVVPLDFQSTMPVPVITGASAVDDLRHCQVETRRNLGAGLHGCAETSPTCLTAVHSHDEGVLSSALVDGIHIGTTRKNLVLNGDRVQLTGANADECAFLLVRVFLMKLNLTSLSSGTEQPLPRRK